MNVPVLKPCAVDGDLTSAPEDLGGERVTCGVPAVAWKRPLLVTRSKKETVQISDGLLTQEMIGVMSREFGGTLEQFKRTGPT